MDKATYRDYPVDVMLFKFKKAFDSVHTGFFYKRFGVSDTEKQPFCGSNTTTTEVLMKCKDKNRPRSPMSAFACFVQVIRDKYRSQHPNENVIFSEFAKKCAEKWWQMSPEERDPFDEMCRLDVKRYNHEMSEYIQSGGGGTLPHHQQQHQQQHHHQRGMKRKRTKDPGMPKRSWSAFFFFCDEYRPRIREAHPDWKVSEIAKELGKRWEGCTDKSSYELRAQNDKLRYEEDMRKYKEGQPVEAPKRGRTFETNFAEAGSGGETEQQMQQKTPQDRTTVDSHEEAMDATAAEDDDEEEEEEDDDDEEDNEESGEENGSVGQQGHEVPLNDAEQEEEEEEEEDEEEDEDEVEREEEKEGENQTSDVTAPAEGTVRPPLNSFSVAFVSGTEIEGMDSTVQPE
nr:unnamed protein product [Spirometra erinaceieuropaei]